MLKFYQNEQSQTFCQTYLRNEQELSTSRIGIASGEIQQDHQHRLPLILSLDQNNGVLNSLNYMVSSLLLTIILISLLIIITITRYLG